MEKFAQLKEQYHLYHSDANTTNYIITNHSLTNVEASNYSFHVHTRNRDNFIFIPPSVQWVYTVKTMCVHFAEL